MHPFGVFPKSMLQTKQNKNNNKKSSIVQLKVDLHSTIFGLILLL